MGMPITGSTPQMGEEIISAPLQAGANQNSLSLSNDIPGLRNTAEKLEAKNSSFMEWAGLSPAVSATSAYIGSQDQEVPNCPFCQKGYLLTDLWSKCSGPLNVISSRGYHFRPDTFDVLPTPLSYRHFDNDLSFLETSPLPSSQYLDTSYMHPIGPRNDIDLISGVSGPCQSIQPPSNAIYDVLEPPHEKVGIVNHSPHQQQFCCNREGCGSNFSRRQDLSRHLICHSGVKSHVCWVPGCERRFSRGDNLSAHYKTHRRRSGRNRYVATLDPASSVYNPNFRGQLTPEGWPRDYPIRQ